MVPTFSDFFKSLYYLNTYLSPVDLSEKGVSSYLLASEDQETASKAQELLSLPGVQRVLSEPLSYDHKKITKNNKILELQGFKILSIKPIDREIIPFYSVIEHDTLPGWILKSGAIRASKDLVIQARTNDKNEKAFFTQEESLLRIEMANRIAKVAREAGIDIVVPKKRLVSYANLDGVTEVTKKYCVICEKIDVLNFEDTVQTITNMNEECQREVAKKISIIVQKAGLVDASFHNISLTSSRHLAFVDTEPAGLMVAKKPGLYNRIFSVKGASVEKCARIGLYTLLTQLSEPGLEAFYEQVKNDYEKISEPKLSKWKITLSIVSFGLVPLINVIVAQVKTKQTKQAFKELKLIDASFKVGIDKSRSEIEQNQLIEEWEKKRSPLAKKFYAHVEGVPYNSLD